MQSTFEDFYYRAEDHYLQSSEISDFRQHIDSLAKCLETYKCLRDREMSIFQDVAEQLCKSCPTESPKLLERALKHWIAVMRYCSMAMLLNNSGFLQYRLLEWLTDVIQAHGMASVEQRLYELLQAKLQDILLEEQFELIQPFLAQAQTTLLDQKTAPETEAMMVGEEA